ncbi:hypothetical protein FRC08_016766 [Ceratobasidium sp. 394]|nr:hypothetical protein FRC08_016766 [Ceratobasidium sp. 394]
MLIPGASYEQARSRKLSIPDLTVADLTRFNLYAPCVSRLDILPALHDNYLFSDWNKLNRYTKSSVLLPNLRTLVFEFARSRDETFVRWIVPFLSAQVRSIYTHSVDWTYEARLSMPTARTLIGMISRRCPAITDLSFFPVESTHPSYKPDPSDDPGPLTRGVHYSDHLKHAHCLQTLTTSLFMLDPDALLILGSLPKLEKLDLYCSCFDENADFYNSEVIPTHAFPSLRTLRLLFPHMSTVRYVWNIKPLVSRLTKVTIQLQGSDELPGSEGLRGYIPEICACSPKIEDLILDFDATQARVYDIPQEMLQALVVLPLRNLDLRHAVLKNLPQACKVLQQCRTLRDLHIQDQTILYNDLLRFAQMPGLECVHAAIHWADMENLQKCRNMTPPRPSSIRFLHFSNTPSLGRSPGTILDITRLLCIWFPKLEEVAWVGTSMCGVGPGVVNKTCVLFNSIIRQVNGHLEEQSRPDWWPLA